MKGIDVSSHQGTINWKKVKSEIDFAIIRCGYGDDIESQDDKMFLNNVNGCIENNIPFGVYLYSYAKNLSGNQSIASEIKHCKRMLNKISKKPFCVYIDMEDKSTEYLKKQLLTNYALEFCKEITNLGYKAGVYANENWFKNYLNPSTIASFGYSIWVAKYSDNKPQITSNYDIWQYSSTGKVNGINGNVDMNIMYNNLIGQQTTNNGQQVATSNKNVNVYYKVKTQAHGWLPEVKNLNDYAGWKNSPITGVAIKVDKGSIKYRVHLKGKGWLAYVTGYNTNDIKNGYAGTGKNIIDAIEVYYYTPNDIRPYKKIYYRANNLPWQVDNEKKSNMDGYCGILGQPITKFEAYID